MSCLECDLHKGGFDTEEGFCEFDILLEELVKSNKLKFLGRKINTRFFEIKYQCKNCDAIWTLSIPDQAFRGGWNEE